MFYRQVYLHSDVSGRVMQNTYNKLFFGIRGMSEDDDFEDEFDDDDESADEDVDE